MKVLIAFAALLLSCLPGYGQSGQPVVPLVAGAAVSSSNPLPVTTSSPSGTQDVNLKQVNGATVDTGHGTAAGAQRVELPTDGTGVVGLNAGSSIVGKVGIDQTTPGTTNAVVSVPSSVSGAGLAAVSTAALAANQIIKASSGNLYSFEVSADGTLSGAAWWIMIYDATSAPVDGAVTPKKCYAMASGVTSFSASFSYPIAFGTGIVIGVSTNGCFTKAASTHAFISGDAQ